MGCCLGLRRHLSMQKKQNQRRPDPRHGTGAALRLAMLILALVTTAVAAMTQHQNRAVQVEAAERTRAQVTGLMHGAQQWARLILRDDLRRGRARGQPYDGLDEPWATPMAEAPLSGFLSTDKDNSASSSIKAFVSGTIEDAQARFNLRNLVDDSGQAQTDQLRALQRLCQMVGQGEDCAAHVASAVVLSVNTTAAPAADRKPPTAPAAASPEAARMLPKRLADPRWPGLQPALLEALAPWVDWLPARTPINVNTASREALVAAIDGLDLGRAQRLVAARQRQPFVSLQQLSAQLPPGTRADPGRVAVSTAYFIVTTRLRLDQRVTQERALMVRRGDEVDILRRERRSISQSAP